MIKILSSVSLFVITSILSLPAAGEDMASVLRESGWDSVIGTWVDSETKGQKRQLKFEWLYKDKAIKITNHDGDQKGTALMAYHPNTGEVTHASVDNQGGGSMGKWSIIDGDAVLDMVFVSGSGDEGGLQVRHRLSEDKDSLTVTVVLPEPLVFVLERKREVVEQAITVEQAIVPLMKKSARGTLKHFPQNVKSVQAWYGHEFMVGDTPVKATGAVSKEKLMSFVGQKVNVDGIWNPGEVWNPTEEEQRLSNPVLAEEVEVVRGEGIEVLAIQALKE